MRRQSRLVLVIGIAGFGLFGCSSNGTSGVTGTAGSVGTAGTDASGSAGVSGTAGAGSQAGASGGTSAAGAGGPGAAGTNGPGAAGTNGTAGSSGTAGSGAAGTGAAAGTNGAGGSGTAGTGAAGTGSAGSGAAGSGGIGQDIPPWRDLNITVAAALHNHNTPAGQSAGMDNRAAKMAGKLVIDMGVDGGGYQPYLGKRGFHVIGVKDNNPCTGIDDWTLGRDFDTDCRLNTLDGMTHGTQHTVSPANSIMAQVFDALTSFEKTYPGEGWGYFLTQDLKAVRWSDVAFTGFSHGAQSAACFAHTLRVYRAVAQSGPRDNTCGLGQAKGDYDPANPPYDPNCPIAHIASWIDAPSATPIDRYFGFSGKQDGQYGDHIFAMMRMNFTGQPVNISTAKAPYGGSHRFYADVGHSGFPNGFPMDAINIAFGVLPENLNPTF